jgi:hypothetical protein
MILFLITEGRLLIIKRKKIKKEIKKLINSLSKKVSLFSRKRSRNKTTAQF